MIIWKSGYRDENSIEVKFFDYKLDRKKYLYFLVYEIGKSSFHLPISEQKAKKILNYKLKKLPKILRLVVPILKDYFQHNL